ncbi:MAG: sigma-54-dependent Fis family transcriptional regulator [Anaerolineae bacterium]|nr:sigma-54-dependent Fis family transcriptional regulator [Gemmatimonadaceae bacterium]
MTSHEPQDGARVLVADDQPDVIQALRLLLKSEGYTVETARSPAGILSIVESEEIDAVLMDLNYTRDTTSGQEGFALLSRLLSLDATLPLVVMTAWGSVDSAVEAMRRGAWDYIEKPWDNARMLAVIRTQIELGRAIRKTQRLEGETRLTRPDGLPTLIAESSAMQPLLRLMERIGPSDANVLIAGEHGTGKELVARWLHAASPRANQPFVAVNMGGLSEGVFESELFGHVKGAFTDAKTDRVGRFELAHGGTLFLDEIANVSMAGQAKLLRVLQTGDLERVGSSKTRHIDVRILSATNVDLGTEAAAGRFREDLLFRLNTIELNLPPLRQRRDDIPPLAMHFLRAHSQRYHKVLSGLDPTAIQALLDHSWPGNIRELDHAIERAVLLAQGDTVRAIDLALRAATGTADAVPRVESMTLEEVERLLIQKALTRFDGNVSQAARALGLSRSALYRRLSTHGL